MDKDKIIRDHLRRVDKDKIKRSTRSTEGIVLVDDKRIVGPPMMVDEKSDKTTSTEGGRKHHLTL